MTTIDRRRDCDAPRPAHVKLEEAAVAVLVERIASLDQEVKDDLLKVIMDIRTCTTQEQLKEVEDTINELLLPSLAGEIATNPGVEPTGKEKLRDWNKKVGQRIRELREGAGLTQSQLADRSGLPQSHISKLENGQHGPAHKTVEAIAEALGITVGEIDPSTN